MGCCWSGVIPSLRVMQDEIVWVHLLDNAIDNGRVTNDCVEWLIPQQLLHLYMVMYCRNISVDTEHVLSLGLLFEVEWISGEFFEVNSRSVLVVRSE